MASKDQMRGRKTIFALYGIVLIALGIIGFLTGAFMGLIRLIVFADDGSRRVVEFVVWYSALPVVVGTFLVAFDLLLVVRRKRQYKKLRNDVIEPLLTTVALTAYNDEDSVGPAVRDFIASPFVQRVIVVSNNSSDRTMERAAEAGAITVNEPKQGYGACVVRALAEASRWTDTPIVALCEGDMTFRANDLAKLLAFIPHADMVNGTRIVEQLQESSTQVSTFIHYGNFVVAKLLELKYLGDATLSDVGTTYKIVRAERLRNLLHHLDLDINLEFNPYFIEQCIVHGLGVIECPITFHPRVGASKGGNISDRVALGVGFRMILGILAGWTWIKKPR